MDNEILPQLESLQKEEMKRELCRCNEVTQRMGLALSQQEITELCEGRLQSLRDSGRVEFGCGILPKLILAFCDSPYLTEADYAGTLAELQECFYYFKSASEERFTDEELLGLMKEAFDGEAQGSVDFLAGTTLEELCRAARRGEDVQAPESPYDWRKYEE